MHHRVAATASSTLTVTRAVLSITDPTTTTGSIDGSGGGDKVVKLPDTAFENASSSDASTS